jgi:two-component system cell cycle sensor histidine kinase/response regulator CckA
VTPEESTPDRSLTASSLAFPAAFEAHPATLLLVEAGSGRIVDANPAAAAFYGHSRDRFRSMAAADLGPIPYPDTDEPVLHRLADGRVRHVALRTGAVESDHGTLLLSIVTDVTESRRHHELARRLMEVLEATTDLVGVVDTEKAVTYPNAAGRALLGYPEDTDAEGVPVTELRPEWVNELMVREAIPTALEEGAWSGETAILTRDGEEIPVSQVVLAGTDDDGRPVYFATIIRDIREARARERAQRESEERYRLLVEQSLAGVYIVQDGRFTYVNPRLAEMLGRTARSLTGGQEIQTLVPEADRASVTERMRRRISGDDGPTHDEVRFVRPDGTHVHVEVYGRRVELDGEPAILGLMMDITARKRAEADLRLLRRAVEQSPTAVMITDRDGALVYVNAAFEHTSGFTREEALGENPTILKSGRQPPEFYVRLWETLLSGKPWTGEFINRRKDGTLYTELATISPVADDEGVPTHFVAVKLDVSAQRRLEELLRHAQKMEAVGRLAGGVAHDFNNILTSITGHARMALEGLASDTAVVDDLVALTRDADRAASLTRQLLAFSRKQRLRPEVMDVREVLADLERLLQRLIGTHIALDVVTPGEPVTVRVDRGQLEQIVLNLVINARDAVDEDGRISLEIAVVPGVPEPVRTSGDMARGRAAVLTVRDNGEGIPDDILPRIFEPFFTTKPMGEGTGLGLSTVYGILRRSGGAIDVESQPGSGTTFSVYLPLAAGAGAAPAAEPEPAPPRALAERTVLVAEDEEGVRTLARRVLENAGHTVLTAVDGLEALERAGECAASIDLLFTDMVMPRMGGKELARRIRELRPGLFFVFTSGYTEDGPSPGERPGTSGFLDKPYTPATLLSAVAEALDA